MTQKEIYEKARIDASRKYREQINELKSREDKLVIILKKLEKENRELIRENNRLRNESMRFKGNPVLTNIFEEITKLNSICKEIYHGCENEKD